MEDRLRHVFDTIGKKYEEEAVAAIARSGAGSVRDMLSVADTCVSYASGTLTYADVTTVLGNADFSAVATLGEAILRGNAGKAFEKTESFLSAGKSVGMLLKDVMNFLNACAVAKTCRDGKTILAFSDEMYSQVVEIAKVVEGHRLLRVMEIFSKMEMDLKYSTSPRILFETAVLKASMPQEDYDIEALIARIATLEKRLEEGNFSVNVGGRVETKEIFPSVKEEKISVEKVEEPKEEMYAPIDAYIPPDEDITGGYAYFDGVLPKKEKKEKAIEEKIKEEAPMSAPKVVKSTIKGDGKSMFGSFLRAMRKTARNGVLLTLCMDLDGEYDGDVFVLYTTSETIYCSLTKPEHYALIGQAFEGLGVAENGFAVRLRGKQSDDFKKIVDEVKGTFEGVNVEVK